jgi:hypothetical protein
MNIEQHLGKLKAKIRPTGSDAWTANQNMSQSYCLNEMIKRIWQLRAGHREWKPGQNSVLHARPWAAQAKSVQKKITRPCRRAWRTDQIKNEQRRVTFSDLTEAWRGKQTIYKMRETFFSLQLKARFTTDLRRSPPTLPPSFDWK